MIKTTGFFKMEPRDFAAAIIFVVLSLIFFLPFATQNQWAGLAISCWLLSALALAIPVYNIIVAYGASKEENKQ